MERSISEHKSSIENHDLEEINRLKALKASRWDQEKALLGLYVDEKSSTADTEPSVVDTSK